MFKGGGRVFGPQPRDYSFKLNKKLKALARMSALTYKAKNNDIVILEDFQMEAPKTKNFVNIMNNLKISDKKSLLVLAGMSEAIYLSSRNLQKAKVVSASDINTYDLLNADKLVLTSGSVKSIEESLSK
jgi:large subunit ribosomal protein L4